MSAADERAKAIRAARVDFDQALELAERVSDAWYRCQSLATVAQFAPEDKVIRVANKALNVAQLGTNPYKRVAVTAWPLRALAKRGKFEHADKQLVTLLAEANEIEPPVSKIDALELLWHAVWPFPIAAKRFVLDALIATCQVTNSWKAGRLMNQVALIVATEDKALARRIIDSMRDSAYKRQAQKRLDAARTERVRSFFD